MAFVNRQKRKAKDGTKGEVPRLKVSAVYNDVIVGVDRFDQRNEIPNRKKICKMVASYLLHSYCLCHHKSFHTVVNEQRKQNFTPANIPYSIISSANRKIFLYPAFLTHGTPYTPPNLFQRSF
ncbi:hypothetical protein TNCV_2407751 [Trichonephila clavipes]|nr:hypothetical protein TNCV_2407751 [Trichonephila clavipes]